MYKASIYANYQILCYVNVAECVKCADTSTNNILIEGQAEPKK